jgi:hypothetical protein
VDPLVSHPGSVLGRLDALAEAGWESAWDGEPELDVMPTQG